MSTKTLEKKVNQLSRQVMSLKTLIISSAIGRDPEGEYRPKFVRQVIKAVKAPGKFNEYKGRGSLLKQLKDYKNLKTK